MQCHTMSYQRYPKAQMDTGGPSDIKRLERLVLQMLSLACTYYFAFIRKVI